MLLDYYSKIQIKNLQKSDIYVALWNLYQNYTGQTIKTSYKSNKLKVSAPTLNERFLTDRLYPVSDIQDYFEYNLKNM